MKFFWWNKKISTIQAAISVKNILMYLYSICKVQIVFTVTQQKNKIGNCPMEEAKKMKCYKRLIYKLFAQVSRPCAPQFLSYLPKRFTQFCRALYGDAILVHRFGAPMWPPEINKNILSPLFLQKLFLFTRELAYSRINISSNT